MISDWSHPAWAFIHTVALRVVKTEADVGIFMSLLRRLFKVLPCPVCAHHASKQLSLQKIPITTHKALCVALWQFHNSVNKMLDKNEFPWDSYVKLYSATSVEQVIFRFSKTFANLSALLVNRPGMRDFPLVSEALVKWARYRSGWQGGPGKKRTGMVRMTMTRN